MDEAYNKIFHQKLESVQYNGCIALSGAIRGSSREKLYQELILQSPQESLLILNIFKDDKPVYLFNLIQVSIFLFIAHCLVTKDVPS